MGRINDHIVEVNGISLVGVSQKFAAQTLSNCAISPETGTVHFVLARPHCEEEMMEDEENVISTKNVDDPVISSDKKIFTNPGNAFLENVGDSFEGRDAVRLKSNSQQQYKLHDQVLELSRFSKQLVLFGSLLLVSVYVTAFKK